MTKVLRLPRCIECRRQLPDRAKGLHCKPKCKGPTLSGPNYETLEILESRANYLS